MPRNLTPGCTSVTVQLARNPITGGTTVAVLRLPGATYRWVMRPEGHWLERMTLTAHGPRFLASGPYRLGEHARRTWLALGARP